MDEYRIVGTRRASGASELQGRTLLVPLTPGAAAGEHTPEPIELLLAAVAADVLAGTRRAAAALALPPVDLEVAVSAGQGPTHGWTVRYELCVDAAVPEARLDQLHATLRRLAPTMRTIATAVQMTGHVRHGPPT